MTETTVYTAWYSYWDSNENQLYGVYRTRESAQKALDAFLDKNVMAKWIDELPIED